MFRLLSAMARPSAVPAMARVSLLARNTPSVLELSLQTRGAKTKAAAGTAKTSAEPKAEPKAASSAAAAVKAKSKAAKPEKKAEPAKAAKPAIEKPVKTPKAAPKPAETKEKPKEVAPKEKTLSPFAAFLQRSSADNKKSTNPLAFVELTKSLSTRWKSMSDEQKKAYEGVKVAAKRRRQPSAFDAYKSERLKEGTPSPTAFKQASQDWKALSDEEKKKYQLIASPKGLVPKSTKRSAWQVYLSQYLMKLDQSQRSKDSFKANLQKAAAEFKKLGEDEKQRLSASG